jgi:hypothetical protein
MLRLLVNHLSANPKMKGSNPPPARVKVGSEFIRQVETQNSVFWPDWSYAQIIFLAGFAGQAVLSKGSFTLAKFNCQQQQHKTEAVFLLVCDPSMNEL